MAKTNFPPILDRRWVQCTPEKKSSPITLLLYYRQYWPDTSSVRRRRKERYGLENTWCTGNKRETAKRVSGLTCGLSLGYGEHASRKKDGRGRMKIHADKTTKRNSQRENRAFAIKESSSIDLEKDFLSCSWTVCGLLTRCRRFEIKVLFPLSIRTY